MGLKIHVEIETPLTKSEAENLMAVSMMNVTISNGSLADYDPPGPDKVCGAYDPTADPQKSTAICTYVDGHDGRHRFINFGPALEE